ncbi:LytTR family transcriptional regulator DNA-binding domain-containing protein [Psychrobacillus sp. INOP01]|uniref:LytTR family transcriptional regulator DNA-binding domain-containing protein n=1 Tax=Psychrobacillus sp. INOP01 TaxID=2829187 RepID=UPI001BAC4FF8|nr:LytTR family transcriptional regulator DNA-binding domain-containing protein [Psychrobacillus sp. INOP01]QUG41161.1 LytTR family transcriptional regulator DNA-binding domain-containing protein [Psychrobacillus sp. INOP01]
MSLKFIQAEKQMNDAILFPEFNLTINESEIVALCTNVNVREQLLFTLLGKIKLSKGNIEYNPKQKLGFYFLREGEYERLTVKESLQFFHRIHQSDQSIEEVLQIVQLDALKNKKIKELTYSEKKRVQLAHLLIQNPAIYIMEEPDQNLDMESKKVLINALRHLSLSHKTILILTNQIESALAYSDKIYRLDEKGLHPIQMEVDTQEDSNMKLENDYEEKIVQPIRFEKIPTKVNEKIVLFDPPEIDYIESMEGQTFLHIKGESFQCTFTLNDLEERLLHFGFFRCHRSYIVNLQKVREVITWTRNSYSLVLDDSEKSSVPLSKTKMADLKGMLGLK